MLPRLMAAASIGYDEFLGGVVCVLTPEVLGGATFEINFKFFYYIFRRCFMRDLDRFEDYFDTIYGKKGAPKFALKFSMVAISGLLRVWCAMIGPLNATLPTSFRTDLLPNFH